MIRNLITETYGGKIDNEGDFSLLTELVNNVLTPSAYDIGHQLVAATAGNDALVVPSETTIKDFMTWIQKLPEREPPTYLGLPANAEKLLLVGQGRSMIQNLGKIAESLDEGEQIMAEAT